MQNLITETPNRKTTYLEFIFMIAVIAAGAGFVLVFWKWLPEILRGFCR